MSAFYQKDIDYHNAIAPEYEAVVVQPRALANDLAFKQFSDLIPKGTRMLDLGCGTGHMLLRYAGQFEDVTGVDHSAGMLDSAAQALKLAGIEHVKLLEANLIEWLDQQDGQYDFISAVGVLHHQPIDELSSLLSKVQERLAPGGLVLIAEPLAGIDDGPPAFLRRWNSRSYAASLGYSVHPEDPDEAPISWSTLQEALTSANLEIVRFKRGVEVFPRRKNPDMLDRLVARVASHVFGPKGHIGFLAARATIGVQ